MSFGDHLPIQQAVQISSIHKNSSVHNRLVNEQTISNTHDFSSTIPRGYVKQDEWCGSTHREEL